MGDAEWISNLGPKLGTVFGSKAEPIVAVAPGRVNLIGEHTDYNDGWVFPMAIDLRVGVAAAARGDRLLRAHSVIFDETREIGLETLKPPGGSDWFDYVAGVAWAMIDAGLPVIGADLVVDGNVPLGSGLSSSAAIEMATALALCTVSEIPWAPVEMALLGQRVEWEWIGVKGGVMDQFIATMGKRGHALLLDCRSLETTLAPLPENAAVVVMDTGAPRTLAGSAYNDRSRSCREAVAVLKELSPEVQALRDVDISLLETARSRMDPTVYRRALHVVGENDRPLALAEAFARSDLAEAGRLMNESHFSLRDLYEVSSRELDLFCDLARAHPACFGARLTGAGFGGCAIALVSSDAVDSFVSEVHAGYRSKVDLASSVFACRPESGARLV